MINQNCETRGAWGLAAAAPSMGEGVSEQPSGILGEIMAELGLPLPAAEDFRRRRLDAASSRVRNETAFLKSCCARSLSLDPQNSQVGDLALRQSFRC
jgi:hypothetical protein